MPTVIKLHRSSGGKGGYRRDLPLERDLETPIVVDASGLGECHPMFVVRLRVFVDWHLAAGHDVSVVPPTDAGVAQQLADMDMARGLPASVIDCLPARERAGQTVVPVRRLQTFHDVEDLADEAAGLLREQLHALAQWGDAMHMAISELCDNALQHGENDLGVYVAADRIETPQRAFRLAIADLGIGIPEHIRLGTRNGTTTPRR